MIAPAVIDTMRRISLLLQAGDFRLAHEQLEVVVSDNPGFAEARRLFAGTKQALGDLAGAEAALREALAIDPGWAPTLATLGELLLNSGRAGEAEVVLQRACAGSPPYPRAALVLARYYNDTQRPAQAVEITARACAGGHADADLVSQHVTGLAALGRQGEAVATFRQAVAASPSNPLAAHALAMALDAANLPVEAEHVARQALTQGPPNAMLHYTHARSLIALNDFDQAETALRACLRLDPRQLDAHNHLARLVWMRTGDSVQATATMDQTLQTFASDDALWAAKAAILQGAGDARGAYACLAAQASRSHASPALLVRTGLAALEFDPATALGLAERALRVRSTDMAARKLMVAAQLGIGDAADALPHCDALLAATPDDQYLIALQTTAWRLLGDERYHELCDYRQLVVPQQFDVPSPWSDPNSFLADVKSSLDRLHSAHTHPLLFQSLRHGTETTEDLTRSADPVIQALFKAFEAPIRHYLERVGHGPDPLRRRNQGTWRFNGSWSVRLRTSGFHTNHVHPRGWISSACYIELPDSMADVHSREGVLAFGEPGIVTTPPLPPEHAIRPEVGMLVLFPSYFWHGTVPISGDQTRLTVAFDVVPDR
ncbi:tetratricopeptide repeat protein [Rhodanobacter sp. C01]|uniref:tetratricopeptide repeat protein n=1 Tax=Rhodanobacter sp. C01 TaxID=1945856 RepID=UPI0014393E4B|nr:tetratricopeptide repeat protein [Rhodanobacter sp. C01]